MADRIRIKPKVDGVHKLFHPETESAYVTDFETKVKAIVKALTDFTTSQISDFTTSVNTLITNHAILVS